jgi:phosphatidate phosphatase APP1
MDASTDLADAADCTLAVGTPAPCMSGTALKRYDAALHALAEVKRVDEVKEIHDKAVAMAAYAKQAKDTELVGYATAIRLRAERRAGEMLAEMAEGGERDNGKGNRNPVLKSRAATPKLADLGISKSQSSKWQRLAALQLEEFEIKVEQGAKKAVSAIDGTARLGHLGRRAAGSAVTDLQKVRRAVEIFSTAPSAKQIAAAAARSRKSILESDLARAIEFLEELQNALCAAERESP